MTHALNWDETWARMEAQRNDPAIVRGAREVRRRLYWTNIRHDAKRIRWVGQRARHGIGTGDAADLGWYLCHVAAPGLRQMNRWAHSYPADREPDAWVAEIAEAAAAIEAWLAIRDDWPGYGAGQETQDLFHEARTAALTRVQKAWHWIADNVDDLWD